MSIVFPSMEWARTLVERINQDPEFAKNIQLDNAAITLSIESEEGSLEDDFFLWLSIENRRIQEFKQLSSPDEMDSIFKLKGKYSAWKKVFSGQIGPTMALVSKKIRVSGNLKELLKNKKAFDVIVDHMMNMDITFAR